MELNRRQFVRSAAGLASCSVLGLGASSLSGQNKQPEVVKEFQKDHYGTATEIERNIARAEAKIRQIIDSASLRHVTDEELDRLFDMEQERKHME